MHLQLRRARLAALAAQAGAGAGTGAGGDRAAEIASVKSYRLREPVSRRADTVVRVETRAGAGG